MHPLDIHWVYTFGSVALVAGASFTGMVALSLSPQRLSRVIPPLVSLVAGALLGTAFGHLLPESVERVGFGRKLSGLLLASFVTFFVVEKLLAFWLGWYFGEAGSINLTFALGGIDSKEPVCFQQSHPVGLHYILS